MLLDPKFSQESDAGLRFDQRPLDGRELGAFSAQLSLAGPASDDRTICMHAEFSHPCRIQM